MPSSLLKALGRIIGTMISRFAQFLTTLTRAAGTPLLISFSAIRAEIVEMRSNRRSNHLLHAQDKASDPGTGGECLARKQHRPPGPAHAAKTWRHDTHEHSAMRRVH